MKLIKAITLGAIFSFLARRKLKFLESEFNWRVVRRGHGAIDYALKNAVLGVSYDRVGDHLLYAGLYHVPSAEESAGVPIEGRGYDLDIVLGALDNSYPPLPLELVAKTLRELKGQLEKLGQTLQDGAKIILMGNEMFDKLEAYQRRVDRDYYRDYILRVVEPNLAEQWASRSHAEISRLYDEWCAVRREQKRHTGK